MKLEQIVHRMATDEGFASAVRKDLEGTLAREGMQLAPDQVAALRAALQDDIELSTRLDGANSLDVWHSPQFEPQTS
jgi:hypothetical protein